MSRGDSWKEIEITEGADHPQALSPDRQEILGRKVAMREKEFGIWGPITWKEYYEKVKRIALGMVSLGLEKGDKVAMIGDNRPEALWAEMAAMCAGGVGVWLFQDSLIDEVLLHHRPLRCQIDGRRGAGGSR